MENSENPWKKVSGEVVFENKWIRVEDHKVVNPGGGDSEYGKVCFKNIAIGVIPIDEHDNTWLVGQFRYTLGKYSWEIPEGGCPLGTDSLESAKRELKEETGLVAYKWKELLQIHTSNSVTDERAIIFVAEELVQQTQSLEETESDLQVRKIPLRQAIEMVMSGQITDSMSVVGLLALARTKEW